MRHSRFKVSLCAALVFGAACAVTVTPAVAQANEPARQAAPADGWASQAGGTQGGMAAVTEHIYTVGNRAQLLAALQNGGNNAKIIKVVGTIDMSDGKPYTDTGDQSSRGAIRLKSNTTLIGNGPGAGIVNGHVLVQSVSQVIIRNLKIVNACDVGPIFDPNDGATGNWNSAYDAIGVTSSDHVWVDHVTFTDTPVTDDLLPVEQGHTKQCHDGSLDITNASDYVTASYNVFGQHNKNILIGSGDTATADEGKLRITFSNNVFRDTAQRSPRVRFGMVHLFNNYYVGSKSAPVYPHSYSVGAGYRAKIVSHNNAFEIAGAAGCEAVVVNPGATAPGSFKDTGSLLNGAALGLCTVPNDAAWTPPYPYTARPAALVKTNAVAQAGGGKLTTSITGTGKVTVDTVSLVCPPSGLYFCDDFQDGGTAKWDLLPLAGPNGSFAVKEEVAGGGNKVLQYTANSTGGVLALVKPSALTAVPSGDYYVEARIRPMTNSTTGNKFLFLVTRYTDAANWYGAGLNVQNSTASTQVEIARMRAGTLTRPKVARMPIAMDAQFYTVRFEMIGSTLTVYLDGQNMGSTTDTTFAARGLIGLYTANKTFMIDDVRVGNPAHKPVQLTIDPAPLTYAAEAGDAPLSIAVTARTADSTQDSFTVASSNPAAVAVTVDGNVVTLTPVGAGRADIVFTSGSEPALTRTIAATIQPQFIQPSALYPLQGAAFPAPLQADTHIDTSFKLVFDGPPTLGSGATIRIFRKLDDALVDVIKTSGETDLLGYTGQAQVRKINTTPISIAGNTVTFKPHTGKLAYDTEYYVAIADGVFNGARLGGAPFVGLGRAAGWTFATRAAPPVADTITVDDDGAADFRTVQGALNHAMERYAKATPVTVSIADGSYSEALYLRDKDNVTLRGASRDGVVIAYANNETLNPGTGASQASTGAAAASPAGGRALLLAETSDLLTLETLSLKNTTLLAPGVSGQAEVLYFNNDNGRLIAKNAAFYSEQDTLNLKGWNWIYRSLVAGNVDFIWGASHAALFEESEIRSVGMTSSATGGGYVLQARVPVVSDRGFVFLNSALTHGPGPGPAHGTIPAGATYLARSGGSPAYFDNIAFVNCRIGTHVAAVGWAGAAASQPAPNPVTASAASGWREYGSMDAAGAPLDLSQRLSPASYRLTADEAAQYFGTRAAVFAGYANNGGWNPQP